MNKEDRENELLALESILDPCSFAFNETTGRIDVFPQLQTNYIKLTSEVKSEKSCDDSHNKEHFVSFLPPIQLNFALSDGYPSDEPPQFNLSCVWLSPSQLYELCLKLDEIWQKEEGNVILYEWFQFLQDDSLSILGINDNLHICDEFESSSQSSTIASSKPGINKPCKRGLQTAHSYAEILPTLLNYDQQKQQEIFFTSVFSCNICFVDKKGTDCLQFKDCGHVYCKQCITSYFEIHISEGTITSLICPEPDCDTTALPNQVKEAVNKDLYERYEKLLLQTTLDTMTDIVFCPLMHCQSAVIIEPEASIGQCPSCAYAFCVHCKLAYHGVSPCKIASHEIIKLCKEYESANEEKKKQMEKKYGRKVLCKALDDRATQAWMNNNTKPCPGCNASIEKLDGCNKMTCYKCRAYFCWICMHVLDCANPYRHYNNIGSPCNNRLFEGIDPEDQEFFMYY
uniref:RBR-type E3 ubiquitin transferase n=1 Tax=Ciona intestinalis TaxID=7719 RepID=Q1RL49_CIOIN|nr:Zn-finger (RING/cysteine-rich C6HC)-7 [Ciona intestinalis]FAA00216.1 TPA: zinc finger protein [Ciona intestinalis]|eukprot:NP_001123340.1 Zn-finger (RING/cysteine-rich C6HC)-7 [Ciona intestinalis]